jgi:glycyl-tRNA synthetase
MASNDSMEKVVSLAKRRGFIYQGSEIYGGLAGTWDYGPYGVALKNNIKQLWWKQFVDDREDMYGLDAALIMNPRVWEASGHVAGFADPLVEDVKTKKRYRADHVLEDQGISVAGMTLEQMDALIKEKGIKSPEGNELGSVVQFNMMFKTQVGATEDASAIAYLRPETAQGIFVNFKNVLDSFHPKLPFGIAQIGKAFRNEIAPRDFIFRTREFEQMEIEYFVHPDDWEVQFESFVREMKRYMETIGLPMDKVHELDVAAEDRAHYSKRTIDFEFDYPFGKKELFGLAYRTDFDLSAHAAHSKQKLEYFDEESGEKLVPHVIEPSLGVDRAVLAVLTSAYTEDDLGGETRVYLKLSPKVAPVKVAIFPLLKNKPELVEKARELYQKIKRDIPNVSFDDNGNIGKRYRRQDEIGTPLCVTIDFETLEQGTGVTVRDRDTGAQERVSEAELVHYLKERL